MYVPNVCDIGRIREHNGLFLFITCYMVKKRL